MDENGILYVHVRRNKRIVEFWNWVTYFGTLPSKCDWMLETLGELIFSPEHNVTWAFQFVNCATHIHSTCSKCSSSSGQNSWLLVTPHLIAYEAPRPMKLAGAGIESKCWQQRHLVFTGGYSLLRSAWYCDIRNRLFIAAKITSAKIIQYTNNKYSCHLLVLQSNGEIVSWMMDGH